MKIVIIGSLSSKRNILHIKEHIEKNLNLPESPDAVTIITPFLNQEGSLYSIQLNYIRHIAYCDLVIAVPKRSITDETQYGKTVVREEFGESTSYELALARYFGKPVLILGES